MATTQFFTRSVFVNVAKCESNWAQAEEEVYNEQSEVIQEFPVFSDNLVSVDSFTEIWPHLFFQMSNPKKGEKLLKQRKFKTYWSRWIKIKGLTAYFIPLSLLWLLSEFCSAVIPATFISSLEAQRILRCLFWTSVEVSFLSSALRFGFEPFPACFRSLLITVFAGGP